LLLTSRLNAFLNRRDSASSIYRRGGANANCSSLAYLRVQNFFNREFLGDVDFIVSGKVIFTRSDPVLVQKLDAALSAVAALQCITFGCASTTRSVSAVSTLAVDDHVSYVDEAANSVRAASRLILDGLRGDAVLTSDVVSAALIMDQIGDIARSQLVTSRQISYHKTSIVLIGVFHRRLGQFSSLLGMRARNSRAHHVSLSTSDSAPTYASLRVIVILAGNSHYCISSRLRLTSQLRSPELRLSALLRGFNVSLVPLVLLNMLLLKGDFCLDQGNQAVVVRSRHQVQVL